MHYYVYVKKIIGVETDQKYFNWNFGSFAPNSTYQDFSDCLIKIKFTVCNDKDILNNIVNNQQIAQFRHFFISKDVICFCQIIKGIIFGYHLTIDNNSIDVKVGKNYYHWVKYKLMNVHPIWYIVYDVVSCLLLKNGLAVLYGSAVETEVNGATIFMGAPGTGKTTTAVNLCKTKKLRMLAEDILITDGEKIWPIPYTNTYRGNCSSDGIIFVDEASAISRVAILEHNCKKEKYSKEELLIKAKLLNRYNVTYGSSPAMIAYNYFNSNFSINELCKVENAIFEKMFNAIDFVCLLSSGSTSFLDEYLDIESSMR